MQIKLENVKYKKLKNISFEIPNNLVTGIISGDLYSLCDINDMIKNNLKEEGNIKYSKSYSKNIGIISFLDVNDIKNDNKKIDMDEIDKDLLKLLDISADFKERDYSLLSTTERIKYLFLECLSQGYDTILVNCIFEELDSTQRNIIKKLIINLRKFKGKTIVISSVDIDLIYDIVDNIILVYNGECFSSKDKYSIYDDFMDNVLIEKPFIKQIENMVNKKLNINLGNNDNVNELIKSIYREMR